MANSPPSKGLFRALSKIVLIPLILCSLWYLLGKYISPRGNFDLQPLTDEAEVDDSDNMAWRSSASTNAALIANLVNNGLIHSGRVKEAMLKVCTLLLSILRLLSLICLG